LDLALVVDTQPLDNRDINPFEVPSSKEDKKTEGSLNDAAIDINQDDMILDLNNRENGIFDRPNDQLRESNGERNKRVDLEEEKGEPEGSKNGGALLSLHQMIFDSSLGIDSDDKRHLAKSLLEYMWMLCQESSVSEHHFSF
jgi:hypothetical protein